MLEEDLNDTQLVETASAITSDLGQSKWLRDRDAQRCRAHFVASIINENKDGDNHILRMLHSQYPPYFYHGMLSSILLEGHRSSLCCGPLLQVIGCHEDGYFVRPFPIKIGNCAKLSSDNSWDELTLNPPTTAFSEHFSWIRPMQSFDSGIEFLVSCSWHLENCGKIWSICSINLTYNIKSITQHSNYNKSHSINIIYLMTIHYLPRTMVMLQKRLFLIAGS